jgi:hypothetical protein
MVMHMHCLCMSGSAAWSWSCTCMACACREVQRGHDVITDMHTDALPVHVGECNMVVVMHADALSVHVRGRNVIMIVHIHCLCMSKSATWPWSCISYACACQRVQHGHSHAHALPVHVGECSVVMVVHMNCMPMHVGSATWPGHPHTPPAVHDWQCNMLQISLPVLVHNTYAKPTVWTTHLLAGLCASRG